jgi:hypothetical protein
LRQRRSIGLAALALVWVTSCGGSGGPHVATGATPDGTTTSTGSAPGATTVTPGPGTTTASIPTSIPTAVPTATTGTTLKPTPAPTTATTAKPTTTTQKQHPKVYLPTGGPTGPVNPPGTKAYQLLAQGGDRCQQLLDVIKDSWGDPAAPDSAAIRVVPHVTYLYRAAAEACLLRFAEAKADFDRFGALNPPPFGDTCEQGGECERCHRLVLEWLSGQMASYQSDPTYAPVYAATGAVTPPPCPPEPTTTVAP